MSLKSGLMIAAVLVGLGATSVAMARAQEALCRQIRQRRKAKSGVRSTRRKPRSIARRRSSAA
jgi:hypothetical protein